MIVYGPIPSRRLGQSIGINNIPPKTCSYSCVYCQLGRTNKMRIKRQEFFKPEDIFYEAKVKLKELNEKNKVADYFSFVPDGEPTLDINLGKTIRLVKPLGVKIAVITNSSLLWMKDVRQDLMEADWVSVSIDSACEGIWEKIDRPHGALKHEDIIEGIIKFSKEYKGTLVTETMFVKGINDDDESVKKVAEKLVLINPKKAYFLVPTRPPAESDVQRPTTKILRKAVAITRGISGLDVECITGDEEEEGFFFSDNIAKDILSICAVHPIREDIIEKLLKKRNADKAIITELVNSGKLTQFNYEGKKFYRKNI